MKASTRVGIRFGIRAKVRAGIRIRARIRARIRVMIMGWLAWSLGLWLQPGGGVLPYMDHTGMCCSTGYGFCLSLPFAIPTLGVTILLPESRCKWKLLLFPLGSCCLFTQTHHFRFESRPRLTFFCLGQGIYFHDFVWNRVAKLCLFSLKQGQIPRHSAAHPHPKWGETLHRGLEL